MTADPADHAWLPTWTLGDRLRKIRRELGLSQGEFANRLSQNPKSYSSWESDQAKPRELVAIAQQIENVTGVPAAWVLGLDAGPFLSLAPQATSRALTPTHTRVSERYQAENVATVIAFPQVNAGPKHAATAVPPVGRSQTNESRRTA
jgi:transcriptional regulator with XRE-family HTH domain